MRTRTQKTTRRGMATSVSQAPAGLLQRQCACGQHSNSEEECSDCKKKKMVMARSIGSSETGAGESTFGRTGSSRTAPALVDEVLHSPGRPLDPPTREFMEPRFGRDFSGVRIHTDARAAASSAAIGAQAWTYGQDIAFGEGMFEPFNPGGAGLLAHELTHVVQQQGLARSPSTPQIGPAEDSYEREAEVNSAAVTAGFAPQRLTSPSEPRVQRSIGSALLDVVLFIPRLFGLEYFPAEDLRNYLAGLRQRRGPQNSLFSDNMARACVSRENEFGPYDTQTKIWLVQEMLTGYTSFLDEDSIITLLRRSVAERPQIVSAIGRDHLWSKFSGGNRRIIEALTLTAADAGDALVDRLRSLPPGQIQEYAANATDPAVRESVRRAAALANMTAPAPTSAKISASGEASFAINGVDVVVQQDKVNAALGEHGMTYGLFNIERFQEVAITPENQNQRMGDIAPPRVSITIWTEFPSEEAKQGKSGYGAGPTLQEHERAHGQGWMTFLKNNPPPVFKGKTGMLPAEFNTAVRQWNQDTVEYTKRAGDFALRAGDCQGPGPRPTDEQLQGTGYTAAICNQQ